MAGESAEKCRAGMRKDKTCSVCTEGPREKETSRLTLWISLFIRSGNVLWCNIWANDVEDNLLVEWEWGCVSCQDMRRMGRRTRDSLTCECIKRKCGRGTQRNPQEFPTDFCHLSNYTCALSREDCCLAFFCVWVGGVEDPRRAREDAFQFVCVVWCRRERDNNVDILAWKKEGILCPVKNVDCTDSTDCIIHDHFHFFCGLFSLSMIAF